MDHGPWRLGHRPPPLMHGHARFLSRGSSVGLKLKLLFAQSTRPLAYVAQLKLQRRPSDSTRLRKRLGAARYRAANEGGALSSWTPVLELICDCRGEHTLQQLAEAQIGTVGR